MKMTHKQRSCTNQRFKFVILNEKFKKIKGDASFREFYRKKNKNLFYYSFSKKEKLKNLLYMMLLIKF